MSKCYKLFLVAVYSSSVNVTAKGDFFTNLSQYITCPLLGFESIDYHLETARVLSF